MAEVLIRLQKFLEPEDAQKAADEIRNVGSLNYINASGDTVNLTVGNVTVENA
ncbi:MAG TPA: hypothetical protein VNS88_02510 [Nitrospiraceae bacterium]|nr:hypothetical protein [Nitrospiraceae bacterium]